MGHLIAFMISLFCAVHWVFNCVMHGIRGDVDVTIHDIFLMDAFVTAAITLGITLGTTL